MRAFPKPGFDYYRLKINHATIVEDVTRLVAKGYSLPGHRSSPESYRGTSWEFFLIDSLERGGEIDMVNAGYLSFLNTKTVDNIDQIPSCI